MKSFNEAAAIKRNLKGLPVANVPEEWCHAGKAAFGGLVGALGLRAMGAAVREAPPLRSVQIVHHAGLAPGAVKFESGMAAKHRNVVTSEVRLVQGKLPCATVSAIFASPTEGGPQVVPDVAPPPIQPDDVESLPHVEGIAPAFTQGFDFRWGEGDFPFSGSKKTVSGGWVRHTTEPGAGPEAIVALLDVWPPAVLPLLSEPSRVMSLSWTVHFNTANVPSDAWYYVRTEVDWMADGFATTKATLQNAHGTRVATMKQLMRVPGK